ncbi:hypothetical protein ABZP36_001093 [Zizania latifolia]
MFIAKLPCCTPLRFSYDFSNPATFNRSDIAMDGSANLNGLIELTQNADPRYKDRFDKAGRASYSQPVPLWDKATGEVASFTTSFSFVIKSPSSDPLYAPSDGLAFFLSSYPSTMPPFNDDGGYLGLFTKTNAMNSSAATQIVAVEFDTYQNDWDQSSDHIGIDVDSINSTVVQPLPDLRLTTGSKPMVARVSYNNSTRMLAVVLRMDPKDGGMRYELNSTVDLKSLLPAQVAIGFSAASGWSVYLHRVLSWSFTSTLVVRQVTKEPTVNPPRDEVHPINIVDSKDRRPVTGVVLGVVLTSAAVVGGLIWFGVAAMRHRWMTEEYNMGGSDEDGMDDEFEQGSGPRRFLYGQLATATNNFSEDGKLGEGGFGSVYRGSLSEPGGLQLQVAVKRISKASKQGRKEYGSEVKIISRLRHRNLVQLVGWCHGRGDFLLVYELVPNGSLDAHLYRDDGSGTLPWPSRYEIALGLGSALLYLHSGCDKCVVHRDIKPSNVMLDSSFAAKLGDFGLAKLVDHGETSQTTVLAGTMGYMDPEYAASGKASTASDVYSFGIVLLEICCGRKPVMLLPPQEIKAKLLEWVWDLHGRGTILEAADERLQGEFDAKQMECVMIVGLWCAHPDHGVRPSIKQALGALQFEAPLPRLPPKMPVPTYSPPPCLTPCFNHAASAASLSLSTGNPSGAGFCSSTSGERLTSTSSSSTTGPSDCSAESSSLLKGKQQQQGC